MKPKRIFGIILLLSLMSLITTADLLTGTPISSEANTADLSSLFSQNGESTFKSEKESNGWVGLSFSKSYKITKVGILEKTENSTDYLLGIFEGANDQAFTDAVPLMMITEKIEKDKIVYFDINVDLSFKYFRYIGPNKKYSVVNKLEVYGEEATNDLNEETKLYQPTNIPLVVIHTSTGVELKDKDDSAEANIIIISDNKIDTNKKAKLKLRGNSTLHLLKKSYKFTLEEKSNILDFKTKSKKWGLLSNHQDRTLIRTLVAFKVSELFEMKYTPQCRSVDVMVDGEYKGNYNLCDSIEVENGRVEITHMDETCNEEPEITGGYLVEIDGGGTYGESDYSTKKRINYNVKYPDGDDITDAQLSYIKNRFNEIEAEVYEDIVDSIDMETYSKYFLIEEYCGNIDAVWSSYYLTKERDDPKFYFGPVWDFDLSLDNDKRLYPTSQWDNFIFKYGTSSGTMRQFTIKLLSNEKLLQYVKDKWAEVTSGKLNKETLLSFIDEKIKEIDASQKLNFMRWDIMNERVFLDKKPSGSFENEVDILKNYVTERFQILGDIIAKTTVDNVDEGVHELRFDPYYPPGENPWGGGDWPWGGDWGDWGDWNGSFPDWGNGGQWNGSFPDWGNGGQWGGMGGN